MNNQSRRRVIIIGGGPAGLTAAYELAQRDIQPIVFERLDKVGGISRTENYKGYHFDMGGHRFFSKSKYANDFWYEIMGDSFLRRPRLSRIYYNQKFFNYPLKPFNVLASLGLVQSILIILSYLRWQIFPYREEETFEQWVTNRFGKRLFETFFESYTEKVWGIPCSELKADWAAQRIKNLSFRTAVISMFVKPGKKVNSLIEEFGYPRKGPGMLWTMVKERVEGDGGTVHMNSNVIAVNRDGNRISSVVVDCNGTPETIRGTDFISSMPVPLFLEYLDPSPPPEVLEAARGLKYRDFITVCLIVDEDELFPDNWIYIHDPSVVVGRVQNYKNWSPEMVPDSSKTSLGLEYFCNEGDELWTMADEDLIELGKAEMEQIGLASSGAVEDGAVFRVEKTYPVYNADYAERLDVIKDYIGSLENFQTIGRNGLHRYNNQDHAMLTGMLSVRNMLYGEQNDLWRVNAEEEYLEEVYDDELARTGDVLDAVQEALTHVFPKLDPLAFGLAMGAVSGVILFLATLLLVVRDGDVIGPNLQLLNQFLFGYSVTMGGSFVGLAYGALIGFVAGVGIAYLRNAVIILYVARISRSAERSVLSVFLDHI